MLFDRPLLVALAAHLDGDETPEARARVMAGVALAIGEHLDMPLQSLSLLEQWGPPVAVVIPKEAACPELLGALHETLLDDGTRRRSGSFYTPSNVASVVVDWALGDWLHESPVVCDPAVGGGAFLLAAANALLAVGLSPEEIVGQCLIGADLDPVAVAVTEAALALWCGGKAIPRLLVADALTLHEDDWPERPDVVVGNPPFLSQLSLATARTREEANALTLRFGEGMGGYADTAALFWVMTSRLVSPGGRVALVLPQSTLAARDSRGVREAVLEEMVPEVLWMPGQSLFGASVDVCITVVHKVADSPATLRTYTGVPPVLKHETNILIGELRDAPNWSHLVADALGVPLVKLASNGETLGDRWQVVADFRDEYYGVTPFVIDDPDNELDEQCFPRLVTVGLIDPARCRWGTEPARFARQRWLAPRVDLESLEASSAFGPWARARLVPKVVLATQTSVLEAAVDDMGVWLPSTPVISVVAPTDHLWHVAVVLLAPPVSAWGFHMAAGAALVPRGLKLSASQVREIPLPMHQSSWDTAAHLVRQASQTTDSLLTRSYLLKAASASCQAYGFDANDDLIQWWSSRLPPPR